MSRAFWILWDLLGPPSKGAQGLLSRLRRSDVCRSFDSPCLAFLALRTLSRQDISSLKRLGRKVSPGAGQAAAETDFLLGREEPVAARRRHSFYSRLNEILDRAKFDRYTERIYRKYCATKMGRLSIAPGVDLRCLLMGYFEGIDSERRIAYLVSVSLSLREFLGLSL